MMSQYTKVDHFNFEDCYNVGNLIVKNHDQNKNPIAIRIYMDDLIVFQYFMDGRDAGNIPWLEGKANTVRKTGISSNVVYDSLKTDDKYSYVKEDKSCKPYGGGYPLYKNETMIAIICVSGYDDPHDDAAIIEQSLNEYLESRGQ